LKDRTVLQLKKVTHKLLGKWKYNLFLNTWKIDSNIRDYISGGNDGYSTVATCDADWRYFEATINFSYIKMKDMEEIEIEKVIIHELLHAVVNEMRYDGLEHEERVVSQLSMIMSWMDTHK